MKTLDEVIKAFEWCIDDSHEYCVAEDDGCPYVGEKDGCHKRNLDALHYLKEYRKNQTDPDGDHQQLQKCQTLLQDFYRNDPITWDELKAMEGRPVWVETNLFKSRWYLVSEFGKKSMMLYGRYGESIILWDEDMGKLWQAYRKERK